MMSASNRAGVLDEVSRPDWHTDPPFGSVAWEAWNFRKRGGEIRSELDADGTDFSESPISTAFC